VPTDEEWGVLINFSDPNANGGSAFPNFAAHKLKSAGLQYWLDPNLNATNEVGFSSLPGGDRTGTGEDFFYLGNAGFWYSSTNFDSDTVWYFFMNYAEGSIYRIVTAKQPGYSVRCLKD
jgi:uncharacterized protein (TIGR02145 family)